MMSRDNPNKKYTNTTIGILDFCEQKLVAPLQAQSIIVTEMFVHHNAKNMLKDNLYKTKTKRPLYVRGLIPKTQADTYSLSLVNTVHRRKWDICMVMSNLYQFFILVMLSRWLFSKNSMDQFWPFLDILPLQGTRMDDHEWLASIAHSYSIQFTMWLICNN